MSEATKNRSIFNDIRNMFGNKYYTTNERN